MSNSKRFGRYKTPPMYEPDWAFHQPEIDDRKWQKLPWCLTHHIRSNGEQTMLREIAEERRKDLWKERNKQKTMNGQLVSAPLESKGNGKPYCGPNWSDDIDDTEPYPELAIDPSRWKFPQKFNPAHRYNRYWTRKNKPRKTVRNLNWRQELADKNTDYLPFIFFSWREMPRLSIYDRAAAEQPEDGMVITDEILKGEWD